MIYKKMGRISVYESLRRDVYGFTSKALGFNENVLIPQAGVNELAYIAEQIRNVSRCLQG
jgi:hypothetical protein